MKPAVIGFSAYSGTGKTTVIESLLRVLTARGLKVGVVKHDVHGFEMDQPGKDTYRHSRAGAAQVVITSPQRTAEIKSEGESLAQCLNRFQGMDLVLVEGFKHAPIPRIGLYRKAAGKGFCEPPDHYIAVMTDDDTVETQVPRFDLNDIEGLADFVIKEIHSMPEEDFTHFNDQGRARMVDVGEKNPTRRTAVAAGRVLLSRSTYDLIRSGGVKKGDVLTVAQVAGIMAAKRTPDLIPMCHPILMDGIDLDLSLDAERCSVESSTERDLQPSWVRITSAR